MRSQMEQHKTVHISVRYHLLTDIKCFVSTGKIVCITVMEINKVDA